MQFFCADEAGHASSGFSNLGAGTPHQWWVCGMCHRPKKYWVQSQGDAVLNFFRGGPLDGLAYKTSDLLTPAASSLHVNEYDWTPETITSEKTGATARVWVFRGGS